MAQQQAPGPRRRFQASTPRRRDRDAEGVEGGEVLGGVSPSPSDYEVCGSVVSSPSGVRGGAQAQNEFSAL